MPFDAVVRKSKSPEAAVRNAKIRSYIGSEVRLRNARKALHAAIEEFEAAVAEVDQTRAKLDAAMLSVMEVEHE